MTTWLSRLTPAWRTILLLFIVSRVALTAVGVLSRQILPPSSNDAASVLEYSSQPWLNAWAVYDTEWYLKIATEWYPKIESVASPELVRPYAFFPLYPALIKLFALGVFSPFMIGLLISNAALLGAMYGLYRLVRLNHDESTAERATKYLLLLPMGFVFSSVYTESLFVLLAVWSIYFARRDRWWLAGAFGGLAALTRSPGVLLAIPFAYEYLKHRKFKISSLDLRVLSLALVPFGLAMFGFINHVQSGLWYRFTQAHALWPWNRELANPLTLVMDGLRSGDTILIAWALAAIITMVLLIIGARRLGAVLTIFGILAMLAPLSTGLMSMIRFTTIVFPIAILFALWTKNRTVDLALTIALALLQGCFMALWANAYYLLV